MLIPLPTAHSHRRLQLPRSAAREKYLSENNSDGKVIQNKKIVQPFTSFIFLLLNLPRVLFR
jgi:hypothetical protein